MKKRKRPERMCVGCREMIDKRLLIRVVRTPEGAIHIDKTGKTNGRGAYICNKKECLEKAIKSNQLERALKAKIPDEIRTSLMEELNRIE